MARHTSVLTNNSALSWLDQRLFTLESALAFVGGIAVFFLMVMAVISVAGRNALGQPLPGYVDWIEQAMPLIAFLGIAYTQRSGGHIRMDMVVGKLGGRTLWIAEAVSTLAMLMLMILLVWGSWEHFMRSLDFSAPLWSRDSSIDIGIPLWPSKLLVPVAFVLLCARLVIQLWGYIQAIRSSASTPVAVPLIEDAAAQAAQEAARVSDMELNDHDNA